MLGTCFICNKLVPFSYNTTPANTPYMKHLRACEKAHSPRKKGAGGRTLEDAILQGAASRRCHVYWTRDEQWYPGVIVKSKGKLCPKAKGRVRVEYDDGQTENATPLYLFDLDDPGAPGDAEPAGQEGPPAPAGPAEPDPADDRADDPFLLLPSSRPSPLPRCSTMPTPMELDRLLAQVFLLGRPLGKLPPVKRWASCPDRLDLALDANATAFAAHMKRILDQWEGSLDPFDDPVWTTRLQMVLDLMVLPAAVILPVSHLGFDFQPYTLVHADGSEEDCPPASLLRPRAHPQPADANGDTGPDPPQGPRSKVHGAVRALFGDRPRKAKTIITGHGTAPATEATCEIMRGKHPAGGPPPLAPRRLSAPAPDRPLRRRRLTLPGGWDHLEQRRRIRMGT
jgi:hypothetical protein